MASVAFPLPKFIVYQSVGHAVSGFEESESEMERYSLSNKEEDRQKHLIRAVLAEDATYLDSMRATLSEFIFTFIFVFAREGSLLALGNYCQLFTRKLMQVNDTVHSLLA